MKHIFVFGAGKSAYYTIRYLAEKAARNEIIVTVADSSPDNISYCQTEFPSVESLLLDVTDDSRRKAIVARHDIVISLLPARFHILLANDCLELGKNLITPSYISPELMALDAQVKAKGLLFLNEIGLDPGIDHMSAMQIIHRLKSKNAQIRSFASWCGGLVAPQSDDNPWHYKFSWAPYNVLRAGYDGALFKENGALRYVPYQRLFSDICTIRLTENRHAKPEVFEGYYNRDSTRYIPLYGLEDTPTFIRGTLRTPGFCESWNELVQRGLTTERISMNTTDFPSWNDLVKIFNYPHSVSKEIENTLKWTFTNEPVNPPVEPEYSMPAKPPTAKESQLSLPLMTTPVAALQLLLERKLKMKPADKDRVVMIHEFDYLLDGEEHKLTSWMDIEGEDAVHTAMAKTVGMPLAIAACLMAEDAFTVKGVVLPVIPQIYEPLLQQLSSIGVNFHEQES